MRRPRSSTEMAANLQKVVKKGSHLRMTAIVVRLLEDPDESVEMFR